MNLASFETFFKKDLKLKYVKCNGKERISKKYMDRREAAKFLKNDAIKTRHRKSIGFMIPKGYVVVDIDEGKEAAKKVIKALGIKTLILETPKGLHCFFKTGRLKLDRKIKVLTPFGLKCDQLPGETGYIILPPNNPERKVYMAEPICKLPDKITPLVNQKDSLYNMAEGDGRNDRMLSILSSYARKNPKANRDDYIQLAKLINKYIFADPLSAKELNYMLKSIEKYKESDGVSHLKVVNKSETVNVFGTEIQRLEPDGKNRFLLYNERQKPMGIDQNNITQALVDSGKICVVHNNIYKYDRGVYVECGAEIRDMIKSLVGITNIATYSRIMEVYKYILDDLRLRAEPEDFDNDDNLINFKNCVYDIKKGKRYVHNPKFKFMSQIPHNLPANFKDIRYNQTKLCEFIKMTGISEMDKRMLMDFMAYILTKNNNLRAFLMLVGIGGTGKSALITYMQKMIGEQNTSAVALQDIQKRFMAAALEHKMFNICADNSTEALRSIDVIKRITGGDTLMCEYKGKDPYPFTPYAKLCFSFNQMPRQLEEKSNAYYDRMRVLRMDNRIILDKEFADDFYSEDEFERILSILVRRLPLTEIKKSSNSEKEVERARRATDSVFDFMKAEIKFKPEKSILKEDLYDKYITHCHKNGRTAHSYHLFFEYILDYPEIESLNAYDKKTDTMKEYIKGIFVKKKPVYKTYDLLKIAGEEIPPDIEQIERETIKTEPLKIKKMLWVEFNFIGAKKRIVREFDFSQLNKKEEKEEKKKKELIYKFDFSQVKYPHDRKVREKKIKEKSRKTHRKDPPQLWYQFDFSQINKKLRKGKSKTSYRVRQ